MRTLLSDTHALVQRKETGHTNRSSLVRDSVSELGGEAKGKKKGKKCEAQRNLETHPKQTIYEWGQGERQKWGGCWWGAVTTSTAVSGLTM